ncbi:MAG: hypothetical protein MI673_03960 [Thiotrichales bacterium]|nr:hypothetical protein [Thiotrichales bacterium]
MLDDMLRKIEDVAPPRHSAFVSRMDKLWRNLPGTVRKNVMSRGLHTDRPLKEHMLARERSRRKCFVVPVSNHCGGIRINLSGRETNGRVNPGRQFEDYCDYLSDALMDWINLDTWDPLVKEVVRTRDRYEGEHVDILPDLLIRWNRNKPITSIGSPKFGIIKRNLQKIRTGDHRPGGMFFAFGPGIRHRKLDHSVSIMDFAPTICTLLGTPQDVTDGNIIREVLSG